MTSPKTPDQLRQAYLDHFVTRGHAVVPSSPLVPENDPTTLFTGSGMQPMVPYLLGETHPKGTRIVDSQKCFRSQDIDEVGDNRHTTFFEMLGNWSLGDYFKQEQLTWVFEFATQVVGLDPAKLYVTVFSGSEELSIPRDTESVEIWQSLFKQAGVSAEVKENAEELGLQDGRLFYYNEKKNWWSRSGVPANMPVGEPGGPDSELFYDFGPERNLHEQSEFKALPCHVNCDCGRFLEIGNSVFMQYQKQADGSFSELPQKNVDFGGGLERFAAAHNDDPDVFKTQLFTPIIQQLESISGRKYDASHENRRSFRVIADHLKLVVMLASDGVFPSNKEQGYFSRRLLRRAVRYGRMIGIEGAFIGELVPTVIEIYQSAYPEVKDKESTITEVLITEEEKFRKTLVKGLKEIEKHDTLTGETAFKLYETYGFPLELTEEIARDRGQEVDRDAFQAAFNLHKTASRTASAGMFKGGLADHSEITTKYHTATHLLHAALRQVLGTHVQQKGSNITGERLRFDYSHPQAPTPEELYQVTELLSTWIQADLPVTKQVLPKADAIEQGAIAFFLDKYPDEVSVYTIGLDPVSNWVSKELCGGPHVEKTGQIGPLKIIKEQAISAGTRRIYLQQELN